MRRNLSAITPIKEQQIKHMITKTKTESKTRQERRAELRTRERTAAQVIADRVSDRAPRLASRVQRAANMVDTVEWVREDRKDFLLIARVPSQSNPNHTYSIRVHDVIPSRYHDRYQVMVCNCQDYLHNAPNYTWLKRDPASQRIIQRQTHILCKHILAVRMNRYLQTHDPDKFELEEEANGETLINRGKRRPPIIGEEADYRNTVMDASLYHQ